MRSKLLSVLLFIFATAVAQAQLCQGSLGDPLVNITFGTGANPGSPLAAAATGYQYVSTDCPNDGFYAVRTSTTACFGSTWHDVTADHTGNGYFMLVNASIQPSAFYVDTVKGLCGNTTYEFAAWVMNVIIPSACSGNSNKPNLTFTIERTDGTVLQIYNTGDIGTSATPDWKQYGFFFTMPSTAQDIVLRITNNAPGGCGNDLALDDITFRPCGPLLTPSIIGQPATTVDICQETAAAFTFTCQVSPGFANPSFQWQQQNSMGVWNDIPGQTGLVLAQNFPAGTPAGTYKFRLSVAEAGNIASQQCRVNSAVITININAEPVTAVTSTSPACDNTDITLTATGGDIYQWMGPNGFTATGGVIMLPNIQISQSGKYYALVKSTAGCQHLDSVIIVVHPTPQAVAAPAAANICSGTGIVLTASGGTSYKWQPEKGLSSPGSSFTKAFPAQNTIYSVAVSTVFGCADTAYTAITVIKKPTANAGQDEYIIAGNTATLAATAAGDNISYSWATSPYLNDVTLLGPVANPDVDTKFIFNVQSRDGCGTASDTMQVFVYKAVFVPNAFTPNGDNKNDTWYIPALNAYKNFELWVFNRYGENVFHISNSNAPWDGTYKGQPLAAGAYVYILDLKNSAATIKGSVLILR